MSARKSIKNPSRAGCKQLAQAAAHPRGQTGVCPIRRSILFSHWRVFAAVVVVLAAASACALAEPVPATYKQGSLHGFLLLKSRGGRLLATGEQTNVVHGDVIDSELVFHFRDGSIDDEVCEYRQGDVFKLIRDHHVQKGPSFPHPLDMTIDAANGQVTWQQTKDGKTEAKSQHMDLPDDLANGMIPLLVEDFPAKAAELKVSYVAADPSPRIVTFSVKPDGDAGVRVGGLRRRANQFTVHIEIGGLAGMIAPMIGKKPTDLHIWAMGGDAPVFIRMEGALYPQGPIWTMALTSPTWPSVSASKSSHKSPAKSSGK
ncbi:MAG TPA: hypothetical protein VHX20_07275 [Terracidiphilus sp.]|nr:hypothetical protein [Terracidiphilus sp.]